MATSGGARTSSGGALLRSLLFGGLLVGTLSECPSRLAEGEHMIGVEVGGVQREFFVSVPAQTAKPRPLITMWHGCGSSPAKVKLRLLAPPARPQRGAFPT